MARNYITNLDAPAAITRDSLRVGLLVRGESGLVYIVDDRMAITDLSTGDRTDWEGISPKVKFTSVQSLTITRS